LKINDVLRVSTLADLHEIMNNNDSVVVDFSAPAWCQPCKRLAPHFAKAAEKSDAVFVEIDIDKADDAIRNTYPIQSVPVVLFFQKGHPTKTVSGRTAPTILRDITA